MSTVVALREDLPEACNEAQGGLLPEVSLDMQRLLAAARDDDVEIPVSKWGGILSDMIDAQAAAFMRMGHDVTTARYLAQTGILALAELMGGKNWYFPNAAALREELRDIEIYRRFNGRNLEVLAREYRVTLRQMYRIISEQRRAANARRQGQLFEACDGGG